MSSAVGPSAWQHKAHRLLTTSMETFKVVVTREHNVKICLESSVFTAHRRPRNLGIRTRDALSFPEGADQIIDTGHRHPESLRRLAHFSAAVDGCDAEIEADVTAVLAQDETNALSGRFADFSNDPVSHGALLRL